MQSRHFVLPSEMPSYNSLVELFKKMKSTIGMHYPSKHSVLQSLTMALEKCDTKDLRIIAFQLDIDYKEFSETKLRLEIQKQVFYKLYNAPIRTWNVIVTSGVIVVILYLLQKLIQYTTLETGLLSPIYNLMSLAYYSIGIVALAGIFVRWLKSKNMRGQVLKLLDRIKSGTLRQSQSSQQLSKNKDHGKTEKSVGRPRPSAGRPRQPSAGRPRQPSAGRPRQPSAGRPRPSAIGRPRPSAIGRPRQPSAGRPRQPSASKRRHTVR